MAASSEKLLNRREFLNYIWAASIAVFMAGSGGVAFAFARPRARPRPSTIIDVAQLPKPGYDPILIPASDLPNPYADLEGAFASTKLRHILGVRLATGFLVLDARCTHLGCVMPKSSLRQRFECPCHGASFFIDGTYVAGPAPRYMDRYAWQALDAQGNVVAVSDGRTDVPIPANAVNIQIWTDKIVRGAPSGI